MEGHPIPASNKRRRYSSDFNPDCPLANFYKFEAIPERFL